MLLLVVQAACSTPTAPTLDQQAYYEQLISRRPELMVQHGESVRDPAWQALVIRPAYREEVLSTGATYQSILEREYTAVLRAGDAGWASSLRDGQKAHSPTSTLSAAAYPIDVYVGYRIGTHVPRDADGYSFKAFLELADFERSLTAERYLAFSEALERAGFQGDSKIDLRPGQVRFQYNNIIVHAPSAAMAQCAEAVGLAFFGRDIAHIARGVDAPPGPGETATDWHHYLLRGGFSRLTETVRDFIQYRRAPSACPNP